MRRLGFAVGLIALGGSAGGCTREALPEICPHVAEGELVISELRGDQAEAGSFGHYLEVYNASDSTIDLAGLRVRQLALDGDELEFFVRESVDVAPGAYAVIGPGFPEDKDSWIDYGFGWDISSDGAENPSGQLMRFRAAELELTACGEVIDAVSVALDAITRTGTVACGNADNPPSASENDLLEDPPSAGCWCVDDLEADPSQPLFGVGLPGTPGRPNRCP